MRSSDALEDVLRLDRIYDAAFDDRQLECLTQDMTGAFGARSSLVHWVHKDGGISVLSHSGYFSYDQLDLYAQRFAAIDPWMLATCSPEHVNQVIDLENLVPHDDFLRSRFFEEYVASMGDNTSRCLGVRLESPWGMGFIGLQRGSDQDRFETSAVQGLAEFAPHLLRMLSIRGRLGHTQGTKANLSAALDARGEPSWILRHDGLILHFNVAAEAILLRNDGLTSRSGRLCASVDSAQAELQGALHTAAKGNGATAVRVPTLSGGIELSLASFPGQNGQRQVLVLASDLMVTRPDRAKRLRGLYGISEAESQIAMSLANGDSISEIATARETSEGTVRFQVKAIANKLGCSRQSEIVAIVLRLPSLRSDHLA